jgi:hypothetical protein
MARKALSFEELQLWFPNEAPCTVHRSRLASNALSMSDLELLVDESRT